MPNDSIISRLKGERGTSVKVSVKRKGEQELLDFEIIRDKIPIYSVDVSYVIRDNTGYIKISRFAQTTVEEFLQAARELKEKGIHKVILDLRGNNGGYMGAATNIADQFLEDGKLIVYTEGKSSPKKEVFATDKGIFKDVEVMILIDEWSASASEILAGAIQDNDRGIIVGRRSFGKGLVQEESRLSDGSALRLTIARYYTPTGRSIQKPYTENHEDYYNELYNRYTHGEFVYADSIQFADSLKYYTPEGYVVYGGGGIMPDIFIPFDTAGITKYFARVSRRGLVYRFTFDYSDKHREQLNQFETLEEFDDYVKSLNLLEEFIRYAEDNGVKRDPEGIKESEKVIRTQIRAYLARNFFDNEGFFPILHEIDNTLNQAVEIFSDKTYEEIKPL